jgi:hypothetical protein
MGGILHHAAAGIICAVIVWFIFKRKDYPLSIFIGNFLPDIVGAGYASLMIRSINPAVVLKSTAWFSIDKDYVTQSFWIFLEAMFIVGFLFFHVYRRRSKVEKKFDKEFEGNLAMLLLGFIIHMMMDMIIIEHGIWY